MNSSNPIEQLGTKSSLGVDEFFHWLYHELSEFQLSRTPLHMNRNSLNKQDSVGMRQAATYYIKGGKQNSVQYTET
jgi:hypothetical protein